MHNPQRTQALQLALDPRYVASAPLRTALKSLDYGEDAKGVCVGQCKCMGMHGVSV